MNQLKLSRRVSETSFGSDVNEDGVEYLLIVKAFVSHVWLILMQGNS